MITDRAHSDNKTLTFAAHQVSEEQALSCIVYSSTVVVISYQIILFSVWPVAGVAFWWNDTETVVPVPLQHPTSPVPLGTSSDFLETFFNTL